MNEWLKRNEPLASWLQGFGVVVALFFGGFQMSETRKALDASTTANEIALRTRLSEVLMRINELSIEHPELSGGYSSVQRLHLIRIEYLFQVYNMHSEGVLSEERFVAEEEYLKWIATQDFFRETWRATKSQYPRGFAKWVDTSVAEIKATLVTGPG
ncbi:hypothetical protein [Hyphomonas sp.]|uniref:hypothetical protein n=1 Tax=Hyphomonas sp. TaxID=87 RepID=UPI003918FA60